MSLRRPGAAVLFLVAATAVVTAAPIALRVYGYASDAPVKELIAELGALGEGVAVSLHDLAIQPNGERFSRLLAVINTEADIPFLPDSVERRAAPPYVHYHNQNRYYSQYESTLTGVFLGESLSAVVMGGKWFGEGFWEGLLSSLREGAVLRVFVPSGTYEVADRTIAEELAALFRGEGE
jgi:hypothetical protein